MTEKQKKLYDEISDIFVSLFNGLLLGDLLSHDAKIPGNNLAWKDVVLCQMWMENQKKNERNGENVDGKL